MYNCIGKRWEFVWGEGSKEYSEQVIRSYVCRHGSIIEKKSNKQLSQQNLAAVHAGGSDQNTNKTNIEFARKLQRLINASKL